MTEHELAALADRPSKPTFIKILLLAKSNEEVREETGYDGELYAALLECEDGGLVCKLSEEQEDGMLPVSDYMDMLLAELRRFPDARADGWPYNEPGAPDPPGLA